MAFDFDGGAVAKLVGERGEECLFSGRNVVGCDATAAVRIDDSTISPHHAVIVITESRATIEDLQSTNGTFRDGVRIQGPAALADGSVVELGSVRLVYRQISTTPTISSPSRA